MAAETLAFQAEVSKLLDIVARSLYSEREIFLRELISNASDACDKLRYESITRPELTAEDAEFRIVLRPDAKAKMLEISDNGIGMARDELVENLGTIARSGTAAFVDRLAEDGGESPSLIGQFGVGFYSAFMVADEVRVTTRRAGETQGWRWISDGQGAFTVEEAEDAPVRGTSIRLKLRKDAKEFLEADRLAGIVRRYSDHVALPVVLVEDGGEERVLNTASALWTRPKSEITDEQYTEFYHHVGHGFDAPWLTLHNKAEGRIEYTSLLFVPSSRPFDLFDPARRAGVKLYVRRIFITDECEGLVPGWLRFLRGVVDSEDLPLNISRETLQDNPVIARIRNALVKRVLGELKKKAEKAPEDYAAFWENFGGVLKEGLYEAGDQRETLLPLARFRSTAVEGLTGLGDYVSRMKEGQDAIFYIAGEEADALARSPQVEGFRARGVEVLLMADPIDEFWIQAVGAFEDKPFRSVTRGDIDLSALGGGEKPEAETKAQEETKDGKLDGLIASFRLALADTVKDVRLSNRLTDSSVCLVADDSDLDMHLERMLKQHKQVDTTSKRILEVNPDHALIRALAGKAAEGAAADLVAEAAELLLDQARLAEGEPVRDAAAFGRRLAKVMERSLAAG
ncbi:MAG: molecular chaperone HtpG [Rhodospirillaceae bacterium]|jgi:molecular chaperone HtpG|nr:molecular chaperone HtpG [Rhodospirillaceae bacterium]MBT6118097.1 molecular chaperone HtpG [Rhodospirillaceae bacterium]